MEMMSEVILKSFTRFWAILGPFRGQSRPFKAKNSKLLHTSHVTTKTATRGAEFRWIWFSMSLLRSSGHLGAIVGPKMAHNDLYVSKVMSKAFPLEFCTSCGRFEWSHDQSATILSTWPKIASKAPKMTQTLPKMALNNLNVLKVTSETTSIGILPPPPLMSF